VGAWPITLERLAGYMQKAVREAKKYTSWNRPDMVYENAVLQFVEKIMVDQDFILDLEGFIQPLIEPGRINSLSQSLIKLTAPGVPDLYQGTELWDLSLVDPDNRRPIDFSLRRELLAKLETSSPEAILEEMDSGLPKLWVIRQALWLRKRFPEQFVSADYHSLTAKGKRSHHVIAFIRGNSVVTVCPCLLMTLADKWGKTSLKLPQGNWLNEFTGDLYQGGKLLMQDLLRRFPVALLSRKAD
jgi:(1->4)-alpha-D-glucan 1-alpha-D-glucosylmutase